MIVLKALALILTILFLLCSCSPIYILQRSELPEPHFEQFLLSVHHKKDLYYVCYSYDEQIEQYFVFSEKRECLRNVGFDFEPIELNTNIDLQSFLGKPDEELERVLGKYQLNLASGVHRPSYITSDAYLIAFTVFGGIISDVAKTDLLTGETVEEYQTW